MRVRATIFLFALVMQGAAFAQTEFQLKANDRVVFYGDSITDQRLYTTFVESYVVTRFPTLPVAFTHSGWGGDRVTGGGGGNIETRLDRDVFAYHPTVLTIMLGMNDGNYKPFDEKTFERFANGFKHIVDSVRLHEPACRITAIEPSAYDDVTREPLFEGGYNAVLIRFSQFLKELAATDGLNLADLNTPVIDMLKRAKAIDPENAKKIINDRVHPGPAGHLIMAEGLLKAWGAPALVSDVTIDWKAAGIKAQNAQVEHVLKGHEISWDETDSALPMPLDPTDKLLNLAVESSDFIESLDREILRVRNLSGSHYELRIDGSSISTFTKDQLEQGVNLARLNTPMLRQSLQVHQFTLDRATAHNIRWRQIQVPMKDVSEKDKVAAMTALDNLDRQLARSQREAALPSSHHFELVPTKQAQ